ncbi:molybdopterin-synthase adenylyltransferase MoeB [Piscinibacter gummiphilus]|uniref:Molybdopterin-synthase adenylyltransferase MoeB n=1 Tax=Piscinibacter gummiphilus TaxID=946333 RepID=A0ABZ0D9K5_9BURK|nr:molybdopterin-synthase adenylyltransferase MoeB [Piscinibacter gummiphilus]WOB11354.1 molybdopterin-synthase adenylyltransferase MoeB [Piscinibacter gummiphilus]
MRGHEQLLADIRKRIPEVAPQEAFALQACGAALIDVREQDEISDGTAAGAMTLSRAFLELRIEALVPDLDRPILVMCASGLRSLLAADNLARLGYTSVRSVSGGFVRWKAERLPIESREVLDATARDRYSRHLRVPEIGESGQLKLARSKVLIVGAGGLGSPAAFYLAAAGVGTIGLVDDDLVERSNLQRQILHTDARVGTPKIVSGRLTLEALNPDVHVIGHQTRLTKDNVEEIFEGYDVVVDGSDNFPTRYLINDACVKTGIPNVYGAVMRFEGQASVFWPSRPNHRGPCYRCLFPEPPSASNSPSCAEAGVVGVLPGIVGLLQANEAIKVLLNIGEPLTGRVLSFDALQGSFSEFRFAPDPACPHCSKGRQFPGYTDYEQFCAVQA